MLFSPFLERKTSVILILSKDAADIKKLLGDVQATVSDDDINRVISSLKGKKVHELIASGIANIGAPSSGSGSASKAPVVKE